jgi:hypothetical protein
MWPQGSTIYLPNPCWYQDTRHSRAKGGIITLHQIRFIEPETIEAIKSEIKCRFVDKLDLSWIKKNERQLKWLSTRIDDSFPSSNLPTIDDIHERDRIIAKIDICNITIREKQIKLDKLKQEWKEELRNDTIFDNIKGKVKAKNVNTFHPGLEKHTRSKVRRNLKKHQSSKFLHTTKYKILNKKEMHYCNQELVQPEKIKKFKPRHHSIQCKNIKNNKAKYRENMHRKENGQSFAHRRLNSKRMDENMEISITE